MPLPPPRLAATLLRTVQTSLPARLPLPQSRPLSQCARTLPTSRPSATRIFAFTRAPVQTRTFLSSLRSVIPKKLPSNFLTRGKAQENLLKPLPGEQYGQQVQIYRIGWRSILLNPLKIYSVLQFAYCAVYEVPSLFQEGSFLRSFLALTASTVPLVFLFFSASYVSSIYLKLPPFARKSRETFYAYLANLPHDAVLNIVTVRVTARPNYTPVFVADLAPTKQRMGCVNLIGTLRGKNLGKTKLFWVHHGGSQSRVKEQIAMKAVWDKIRQFHGQKQSLGWIDPRLNWWEHIPAQGPRPSFVRDALKETTKEAVKVPVEPEIKAPAPAATPKVTKPGAVRKIVRKVAKLA
ncbi:hypothetical protein EX30DRAFT_122408 [Ascodesmis nigricans]|uniref:Uncharacterized protein n=1 Tax=Ascodesmis nigricans TaxID=341454 RepID=A0A4S2MSK7_9PEZI|nr:hypothetical protein EX30DRAFT_122408 [Ascodesmis nigricans]